MDTVLFNDHSIVNGTVLNTNGFFFFFFCTMIQISQPKCRNLDHPHTRIPIQVHNQKIFCFDLKLKWQHIQIFTAKISN